MVSPNPGTGFDRRLKLRLKIKFFHIIIIVNNFVYQSLIGLKYKLPFK